MVTRKLSPAEEAFYASLAEDAENGELLATEATRPATAEAEAELDAALQESHPGAASAPHPAQSADEALTVLEKMKLARKGKDPRSLTPGGGKRSPTVAIRFPEEMLRAIDTRADEEGHHKRSTVVREAVALYLSDPAARVAPMLSVELQDAVRYRARQEGRSEDELVREVLTKHLLATI